jgi:hypothetical protein
MKQKYITFETYGNEQHLIPFPDFIQHSVFAKQIQEASPHYPMVPVSAGFIVDARCEGISESLQLKSRPKEDTDLLIKMLAISQEKLIEVNAPRKERTKNQLKRDRKKRGSQ